MEESHQFRKNRKALIRSLLTKQVLLSCSSKPSRKCMGLISGGGKEAGSGSVGEREGQENHSLMRPENSITASS